MISDFLSWISHGWVVTFQDSHRTVFTFRSWLDLLGVVLAFWISILKISKLLQNCWHRVIDITSFQKHLESSLDHTLNFCRNLVIFRSKNIWLLQPSDLSSLSAGRSIACPIRMSPYIYLLYYIYHLCLTCNDFYDLSAWGGCWFVVYIRRFIYKFLNVCPFD